MKCLHIHLSVASKKLNLNKERDFLGSALMEHLSKLFIGLISPFLRGEEEQILQREINVKGTFYCGLRSPVNEK